MTAPNHIAGGLVFTGLFASFMDVNVLANPYFIGCTVVGSLLPDADHTRSWIGKLVYPIAWWLHRRYGHRTITHTLIAWLGLTGLVWLLGGNFNDGNEFTILFLFAYLSHLVLDMMTLQGVPFLYPFMKNPCVLPAKPEMRFRTGDLRTETLAFSFFLFCGIFCYPLFANGFWTQYNRTFGGLKQLKNEFIRSDNLLEVDYQIRIGSQTKNGKGYCIEALEGKAILLENEQFITLDKSKMVIENLFPTATDKQFRFKTQTFIQVSIDSVYQLLQKPFIKTLELTTNKSIQYIENGITLEKKQFKGTYLNDFTIVEIPEQKPEPLKSNPRIKTLAQQIQQFKAQDLETRLAYEAQLNRLRQLEEDILTVPISERERLSRELQQLRQLKAPTYNSDRIELLNMQRLELIKLDNQRPVETITPLRITGIIEWIEIYN